MARYRFMRCVRRLVASFVMMQKTKRSMEKRMMTMCSSYIGKKFGWDSEEVKEVINRRKIHRGIPIPSDSPLHMVREHSKHFDFKSEEIIMLEGSDSTPLQTQRVERFLELVGVSLV